MDMDLARIRWSQARWPCAAAVVAAFAVVGCRSHPVGDSEDGTDPDPREQCYFGPNARFPATVVDYEVGGASNTNMDPRAAEGPPDCGQVEPPDLSLGGGYVVFDLACWLATGAGPELRVWESDSSYCAAFSEEYTVSVSQDGHAYVDVGSGDGVTDFDITTLTDFRFVRIDDPDEAPSGSSPGPDIDALEVLQLQ